MAKEARHRLIVALDYPALGPAYSMARRLAGLAQTFKVGSQLFTAEGPRSLEKLAATDAKIFLDLKFHDIPNTVAGAVAAAASLPGVSLLDVHALGGHEMLKAAARAVSALKRPPKLLAITVLTSLDAARLHWMGIAGRPEAWAVRLAKLAQGAGLDGVVASAGEIRAIRRACGKRFLIVVPGIRPSSARVDDQARVATPAQAIRAGADYLVVGRPITAAADPRSAAARILEEMDEALGSAV